MQLHLTDDQETFRSATERFLAQRWPRNQAKNTWAVTNPVDPELWMQAAELGWTAPFVPEQFGGGSVSSRPVEDAAIIAEEVGRVVAPGPLVPVNVVALAVAESGPPELQSTVLPALATGHAVATWAIAEPGGVWSGTLPALEASAKIDGDTVVLNGQKAFVEGAGDADYHLVTARTDAGLTQVLLPSGIPGLDTTRGRSLDINRRFGRLSMTDCRVPAAYLLGTAGMAGPAVEHQLEVALALQCAETVGAAGEAFELTIRYGRERYAFGRPIVSYQAVKHRLADLFQWLEFAKAVTERLVRAIDSRDAEAPFLASAAKAYVAARCLDLVDECVQLNGGIGVTWEHDMHLFSRRIAVNRAVWGTPEQHKERICMLKADTLFRR